MNNRILGMESSCELNPTVQCNDLKAFERRLMETIMQQKPKERRWRVMLLVSLTITGLSSYFWLQDSMNAEIGLIESLAKHYIFTANCFVLIGLLIYGVHNRVIQTSIIINRIRQVLFDFSLTCDDNGKLIIKQNLSRSGSGSFIGARPSFTTNCY